MGKEKGGKERRRKSSIRPKGKREKRAFFPSPPPSQTCQVPYGVTRRQPECAR